MEDRIDGYDNYSGMWESQTRMIQVVEFSIGMFLFSPVFPRVQLLLSSLCQLWVFSRFESPQMEHVYAMRVLLQTRRRCFVYRFGRAPAPLVSWACRVMSECNLKSVI